MKNIELQNCAENAPRKRTLPLYSLILLLLSGAVGETRILSKPRYTTIIHEFSGLQSIRPAYQGAQYTKMRPKVRQANVTSNCAGVQA